MIETKLYWPKEKPTSEEFPVNFFDSSDHYGQHQHLPKILEKLQPKYIIELGSAKGESAKFFMDQTSQWNPLLFCVDRWDMEWLYTQFAGFIDHHQIRHKNIYQIFLNHLWDDRERIVPLRMDTLDGLRTIKKMGVPIDLIYIDANHTYDAVKAEIELVMKLFPDAIICGDDYSSIGWPGVVRAVDECAQKYGFRLEAHHLFWIYHRAEST